MTDKVGARPSVVATPTVSSPASTPLVFPLPRTLGTAAPSLNGRVTPVTPLPPSSEK